jgi:hypothetical protein
MAARLLRVLAAVVVIVTPPVPIGLGYGPIMRAGGRDDIGRLADAGDDCVAPGR